MLRVERVALRLLGKKEPRLDLQILEDRVASFPEEKLDSLPKVDIEERMFYRGSEEISTRQMGFRKDGPMVVYGITNPKWYTIRVVPFSEIIPSQHTIQVEGLKKYIKNSPEEIPEIGFNRETGNYHVLSGHTRLMANWLTGINGIPVKVFEYERDPKKPYQFHQVRPE